MYTLRWIKTLDNTGYYSLSETLNYCEEVIQKHGLKKFYWHNWIRTKTTISLMESMERILDSEVITSKKYFDRWLHPFMFANTLFKACGFEKICEYDRTVLLEILSYCYVGMPRTINNKSAIAALRANMKRTNTKDDGFFLKIAELQMRNMHDGYRRQYYREIVKMSKLLLDADTALEAATEIIHMRYLEGRK